VAGLLGEEDVGVQGAGGEGEGEEGGEGQLGECEGEDLGGEGFEVWGLRPGLALEWERKGRCVGGGRWGGGSGGGGGHFGTVGWERSWRVMCPLGWLLRERVVVCAVGVRTLVD
jgi:hypothetical protein